MPGFTPVGPTPFLPPTHVEVQTGRWIGEGWELVKNDMGTFVLITLVSLVLNGVVPFVLSGPLHAGLFIALIRKLLYGRTEVGDLFKGFSFFVPTLVAAILIGLFTFIGSLLCVIPGIIVAAMYMFTYLFIVDKKMDFWPAMEASHAVVKNSYWGFFVFILALALVNIVGALCCIVGLLVTVPVSYAAIAIAYRDLVGFEPNSNA
jgi:uncharacterized membrane protein